MSLFNDRKPGTLETWLDDSGAIAHVAIVQDPGNPLCIYYNGVLVDLSAHRQIQGTVSDFKSEHRAKYDATFVDPVEPYPETLTKFGSQSTKFDGLRGLDMIDAHKEIAEKFAALVEKKDGWYRGIVDYKIEDGNVTRIDELKIMHSGPELPNDLFTKNG